MSAYARPSVSLCAWAFNEEAMIEEFVRKTDADLKRASDDYELIVVDDGSTDATLTRLRALELQFPARPNCCVVGVKCGQRIYPDRGLGWCGGITGSTTLAPVHGVAQD